MPLMKSKSKEAFKHNIKAEMDSGKPQDQALAIAYSVKRKSRKKMADGGQVADPIKLASAQDSMRKAFHYAEGGEVDEKVDKKEHEEEKKIPKWHLYEYADGGEVENEELHPEHSGVNPMPMDGIERLSKHEQEHDEMYKPYAKEASGYVAPASEDLPEHMMAQGGMMFHPKHIVDRIMEKRRNMMYSGGLVKGDNFLDSDVDDSDEVPMYKDEHPDHLQAEDWSMDNEDIAGAQDYLEDGENAEMKKKRKRAMIQDIMHRLGENEP